MNAKIWFLVLIAGNAFCARPANPQQRAMLHKGNPANSDDKYVVYTERLRRAIKEFGLTDAQLNLRRESRDDGKTFIIKNTIVSKYSLTVSSTLECLINTDYNFSIS